MKRLLFLCFLIIFCSACRQEAVTKYGRSARNTGTSVSRNLTQAMDYLTRANEFDQFEAHRQVAFLLNRWLEGQTGEDEWKPDPLMSRLPPDYRNSAEIQQLARQRIQLDDVHALQQAIWLRDVSRWVSQRSADPSIEAWVEAQYSELGEFETGRLLVATRLFDWTVRNVLLNPLLPYPSDSSVGPRAGADQAVQSEAAKKPPPMEAVPGPGYQFQPWQTLLYGHGDSQQRARVFIGLCRQQGIDAAMLAFPSRTIPPRPRPWLPAVLVAGQLYLFDTQLGLPIPGPGGNGVATLEQVREDRQLLSSLSVGSTNSYDVDAEDLEEILALMEVSPYDASRRMELIEQQMSGEYRVVLTVSPTELSKRLAEAPGVDDVAFWRAPIEACWFWDALQRWRSENQRVNAEYMMRYGMFETRNTLLQGRQLHFRGVLETESDEDSAIKRYLATRIPQDQIDNLHQSESLQKGLGLVRLRNENDMTWSTRLAAARSMVLTGKEHASYWLGLAQYELGRFDSAQEWFQRRTLEVRPQGIWAEGARYNLGRSLEAMGQLAEARDQYLATTDSAQHHGDLIRARMLAKRIGEQE